MMDRRIQRLESHVTPEPTERERGFLAWISTPSITTVLARVAEEHAHRRCLHESGETAGERVDGGGWFQTTHHSRTWYSLNEEERQGRTAREWEAMRTAASLADWLAEPDRLGWPELPHAVTDMAHFCRAVRRDREMLAVHRGHENALARRWRREHPGWHPDMSDGAADDWELDLIERGAA